MFRRQKRVESARTLDIYLSYSRKEDFGELKAPLERSGAMELREAIMTAAEQLKQEGKAEGRLEGRLEAARRMEEEGMELRLIAKITDLTTDELMHNGIGRPA
ncbi:MAG: hypothetical protein HS115_18515 [Spirochaetales bacterium]|nr:hypothetical protein [Spirochaetales bacterium]